MVGSAVDWHSGFRMNNRSSLAMSVSTSQMTGQMLKRKLNETSGFAMFAKRTPTSTCERLGAWLKARCESFDAADVECLHASFRIHDWALFASRINVYSGCRQLFFL